MSFKLIILAPPTHFPVGLADFLQVYPEALIEIYHPDYGDLGKYFFAGLVKDLLFKYRQISLVAQTEPKDKTCDLYLEVAEVERPPEEEAKFPANIWPRSRGSLDLSHFLDLPKRLQEELWEIQKTHNAVAPFLPHREKEVAKEFKRVKEEHGGYDLSWWEADKKAAETLREVINEKKATSSSAPSIKEEEDFWSDVRDKEEPGWWSEKKEKPSLREWSGKGARPFYQSLKIDEKLSPTAEKEHLTLLKEVTGFLMGEKDLSFEAMETLDLATIPEALNWFQRFCRQNEIEENLAGLHSSLEIGYLWWQIKKNLAPPKKDDKGKGKEKK